MSSRSSTPEKREVVAVSLYVKKGYAEFYDALKLLRRSGTMRGEGSVESIRAVKSFQRCIRTSIRLAVMAMA